MFPDSNTDLLLTNRIISREAKEKLTAIGEKRNRILLNIIRILQLE